METTILIFIILLIIILFCFWLFCTQLKYNYKIIYMHKNIVEVYVLK